MEVTQAEFAALQRTVADVQRMIAGAYPAVDRAIVARAEVLSEPVLSYDSATGILRISYQDRSGNVVTLSTTIAEGNTQGTGGLTRTQVDTEIRNLVADFARRGATTPIPLSRLANIGSDQLVSEVRDALRDAVIGGSIEVNGRALEFATQGGGGSVDLPGVTIRDEGGILGTAATAGDIDFRGPGVTATRAGATGRVTVQIGEVDPTPITHEAPVEITASPASSVAVTSGAPSATGAWGAWTTIESLPAITAAQAGHFLLIGHAHVEIETESTSGGDRFLTETRMVIRRNSTDVVVSDNVDYGPRNINNDTGTSTNALFATASKVSDQELIAVADLEEGDVVRMDVRLLNQSETEAARSAVATNAANLNNLSATQILGTAAGAGGGGSAPAAESIWKAVWNNTATYDAGDIVRVGNVIYLSLRESNTNNAPASTPSWWVQLSGGLTTADVTNAINAAIPILRRVPGFAAGDIGQFLGVVSDGSGGAVLRFMPVEQAVPSRLAPAAALPDVTGIAVGTILNFGGDEYELLAAAKDRHIYHGVFRAVGVTGGPPDTGYVGDDHFWWNATNIRVRLEKAAFQGIPSAQLNAWVDTKTGIHSEILLARAAGQDTATEYAYARHPDSPDLVVGNNAEGDSLTPRGQPFAVSFYSGANMVGPVNVIPNVNRWVRDDRVTGPQTERFAQVGTSDLIPVARLPNIPVSLLPQIPASLLPTMVGTRLLDHEFPGMTLISTMNDVRPQSGTLFNPRFDLDTTGNGRGEFHCSLSLTIAPTSDVNMGFEMKVNQTAEDRRVDDANIVFASALAAESAWTLRQTGDFDGLVVFERSVFSDTTLVGVYRMLLVHNANNEVGTYHYWEGQAGSTGATITAEMRVTFTPTDPGS